MTDCVVYNLPGPWLDGLFEMDTLLGAQFFEFVCLVLLERSVLPEQMNRSGQDEEMEYEDEDAQGIKQDESEGL